MKFFRKPLILLACLFWLIPASGHSGFIVKDRTTNYQINFDLDWLQKFLNLFLKYEVLSWKEAMVQELFIKGSGDLQTDSGSELIMASITPKNFNEALFLRNAGKRQEGFLRFVKYEKLSAEGAKRLLEIVNFIYNPAEEQTEFLNVDLLEENPNKYLMDWVVVKKKDKDRFAINIQITVSNSQNSKKGGTSITAVLNPLEHVFEKIKIDIKGGPRFELIKKPF